MWELIIAYTITDSMGDVHKTFTRQSTHDYHWDVLDDGYWSFSCSNGKWNGTFKNVLWFTETKISDGEATTAQIATAQGEDPVTGTDG